MKSIINPYTSKLQLVSESSVNLEYPKGYFVDFLPVYSAPISFNFPSGFYFGSIVRIKEDVKIESSLIAVNSASTGSGIIGIYKYNESTTDFELKASVDGIDLTLVADQILSYPSTISLESGIYAVGFNIENTTSMSKFRVDSMELIFGKINLTGSSGYINAISFPKVYDGTLPSSVDSTSYTIGATSNGIPAVLNKIA
jgi:hypothetical protein